MRLLFDEAAHKYFLEDSPEIKLTSVSKVIEKYHEHFDIELRSFKYAEELNKPLEERLKYIAKRKMSPADSELFLNRFGFTQDDVKKLWAEGNKESTDKGHLYHAVQEERLYKAGGKVFKHEVKDGYKVSFDITNLQPGVYPELMVYLPEFGITGTADYVEIYDDMTFDLEDHKTNKKLEWEGFPVFNPVTKLRNEKKMFAPIAHLGDCNGSHYTIQLSIYAFALEEAGYTLRSGGLKINHALFDETNLAVDVVSYPVNYLKREVKALLTHFKQNYGSYG